MKVFVYNYREFDEAFYYKKYAAELDVELAYTAKDPVFETVDLAKGCDALSIITTKIDAALMERFASIGIKMISTRTIGHDHLDKAAAARYGISLSNISYAPDCVAEYTVMLMLMSLRKTRRIMERAMINNFSLNGLLGGELSSKTVGIIGTGRIGHAVIRILSGFGCNILCYDPYPNEEVNKYAEYVAPDDLLRQSDVISLHVMLNEQNRHMIDEAAFSKMKPGVVIVNTGRGPLIDTAALIEAIKTGIVGAAGLDVIENEFDMYYNDLQSKIFSKPDLFTLRGFPNVIVTPHMAFYTDHSVSDMVYNSLLSIKLSLEGKRNPWLL